MEKPKLFFGLKRSKISHDEKILSFTYQKVDMPLNFLLKNNVKQIFNQGDINSCSANAVSNQLLMSDNKNLINFIPSRMYIYFNSRFIDNDKQMPLTDSGASLKSVYQALSTYKFTSEDIYPYEIQNVILINIFTCEFIC